MDRYQLHDRLVDFAVSIIDVTKQLNESIAAKNIAYQLSKSGTSTALNYAEALSAESKKDFIHKLKIVLKELRESMSSLIIIHKAKLSDQLELIQTVIKENNELISIFVTMLKSLEAKLG